MLLPLSQSLYVEGELADADNVLLDIGTGYYLEVGCEGIPKCILLLLHSCKATVKAAPRWSGACVVT